MPTPREPLAVPLPLEQYADAFDELFHTHIQRRRFRSPSLRQARTKRFPATGDITSAWTRRCDNIARRFIHPQHRPHWPTAAIDFLFTYDAT
jgi:hypothetical protein